MMTFPPVRLASARIAASSSTGSPSRTCTAVAVGGLHDQIVGLLDDLGIAHDGLVGLTHVAAEEHLDRLAPLLQTQLHEGRAQDVAGIVEHHGHAGSKLLGCAVVHRLEEADRPAGVVLGVERVDVPASGPASLARAPLRLVLLDVRRVEQHDLGQVAGGQGRVDGLGEALLHQPRDPSRVIDVGMGQEHEVQLQRIEGERVEVESLLPVSSLVHAAIHQEAGVTHLDHVARSGDLTRRPGDLQEHPTSLRAAVPSRRAQQKPQPEPD